MPMKRDYIFVLTFCTALGCGLVAGVFFAFSSFVMPALERLPAAQGVTAMQSINIQAVTPVFMTAFVGTAVACIALAIVSWRARRSGAAAGAGYVVGGSLLYFVGTFLVTIVFNVPLNDALAVVDPAGADAGRVWADYLAGWNPWNHFRGAASLAATALFTVALYRSRLLSSSSAVSDQDKRVR
jgi:uncharacterized membrane protein